MCDIQRECQVYQRTTPAYIDLHEMSGPDRGQPGALQWRGSPIKKKTLSWKKEYVLSIVLSIPYSSSHPLQFLPIPLQFLPIPLYFFLSPLQFIPILLRMHPTLSIVASPSFSFVVILYQLLKFLWVLNLEDISYLFYAISWAAYILWVMNSNHMGSKSLFLRHLWTSWVESWLTLLVCVCVLYVYICVYFMVAFAYDLCVYSAQVCLSLCC